MIPAILPSGREILLSGTDVTVTAAAGEVSEGGDYRDVAFHLEFQDLVDVATEIGQTLRKAMETIRPQKATVELSVGVDASTGRLTAFFVDGGVKGAMKLTLQWGDSEPESA